MPTEKVFISTDRETLSELLNEIFVSQNTGKKGFELESERKTQRETAKFLNVSYQTVGNWTKTGMLKKHGYGRKFYYLRSELIEVMTKIVGGRQDKSRIQE